MAHADIIAQLKSQIDAFESGAPSIQESKALSRKRGKRSDRGNEEKDFSSEEEAFRKIVALVNISDRSEHTIRERLTKAGFEQRAVEQAIVRAKSYGFIDDCRFADVLIRSRLSQGKGSQGIVRELAAQNIDIETIPGWPYEYDVDDDRELERALALLNRKPPRSKNKREGAFRKLMGSGFSSSVASSAARMWTEQ